MFEFEPGLMVWTSVSFAILVFLMYKLLLPPILKVLKDREKAISDSLKASSDDHKRAEELVRTSNLALAEANKVAARILMEARAEGEKLKGSLVDAARREADLIHLKAGQDLDREKNRMISEIRRKTADIVILASSKVIRKNINKKENMSIVEGSLKEWQK